MTSHRVKNAVFFICLLMVPALIYSKALITICYGLFFILAIAQYVIDIRSKDSITVKRPISVLFFFIVFFQVLFSGINSTDIQGWSHHLILKLPFFILPLAFYLIKPFNMTEVIRIHIWLIFVLFISSLPVLHHYFQNKEELLRLLGMGQAIPTPIEHVKYSMMNAYAAVSGLIIGIYYRNKLPAWTLCLVWFCTGWGLLYMHILAVRTGLVIAYASILILLALWIIQHFSMKAALLLPILFIGVIWCMIQSIPSLQTKISYMKYDWKMYSNNTGTLYSDSDRMESLKIGWNLFIEHPISGAGIGDLSAEVHKLYKDQQKPELYKLPHSQIIHQMAGSGLIGLTLLLIGFYGPYFMAHIRPTVFLSFLYLNYSLSFLVENSLERSASIAFFLLFALISLQTELKG